LLETYQDKAPTVMGCLELGLDAALTVLQLPEHYRQPLRTTNLAERMNEEIRRRERVIRIFPNTQATIRLIDALLAEKQEDWCTGKKYFDMQEGYCICMRVWKIAISIYSNFWT
jgi:putative transposase